MTSNPLGNSELHVSSLGFGAWPIGGTTYGDISRNEGQQAIGRYLDLGGRHIDTARGYRTSESIIGDVLSANNLRSEIVLASKTKANTPGEMRLDLENTLRELKTEYVDIYYLHQPPADPKERDIAIAAMSQFRTEGKIRVIGASINGPNVTAETEQMCRDYIACGQIGAIQLIFSIFRQRLRNILPLAKEKGVGIIGRTALESGFLTGKYSTGCRFPAGDHRNRWPSAQRDHIMESVSQVHQLLKEASYSAEILQAAIRFAVDEPGIDTVILGAKNSLQSEQTFRLDQIPPIPESLRQQLIASFDRQDTLYNLP